LPEPTAWRNQIPPEAKATLLAVLQKNFEKQSPPVIDLRDTMSDEMFTDYLHLNENGRKAFSLLVAKQLQTNLRTQQEPSLLIGRR
jgi:lysophospholipase L1-like esterase